MVRSDASLALADIRERVGQVDDAALAEQDVEVELRLEAFPELERELVDPGARVPEVVGPDDRGVAAHVAEAKEAALEHRDVA